MFCSKSFQTTQPTVEGQRVTIGFKTLLGPVSEEQLLRTLSLMEGDIMTE